MSYLTPLEIFCVFCFMLFSGFFPTSWFRLILAAIVIVLFFISFLKPVLSYSFSCCCFFSVCFLFRAFCFLAHGIFCAYSYTFAVGSTFILPLLLAIITFKVLIFIPLQSLLFTLNCSQYDVHIVTGVFITPGSTNGLRFPCIEYWFNYDFSAIIPYITGSWYFNPKWDFYHYPTHPVRVYTFSIVITTNYYRYSVDIMIRLCDFHDCVFSCDSRVSFFFNFRNKSVNKSITTCTDSRPSKIHVFTLFLILMLFRKAMNLELNTILLNTDRTLIFLIWATVILLKFWVWKAFYSDWSWRPNFLGYVETFLWISCLLVLVWILIFDVYKDCMGSANTRWIY